MQLILLGNKVDSKVKVSLLLQAHFGALEPSLRVLFVLSSPPSLDLDKGNTGRNCYKKLTNCIGFPTNGNSIVTDIYRLQVLSSCSSAGVIYAVGVH